MKLLLTMVTFTTILSSCSFSVGDGSANTNLDIEYNSGDGSNGSFFSVVCNPGEQSNDVCSKIQNLSVTAFEPTPSDAVCTEQYGGPETAHIKGVFRGEEVDATFSRENGCEIARWDKISFLLV